MPDTHHNTSVHCERSTFSLPPSDLARTSTTTEISSTPLGSPGPSPHFRPYRDGNHDGDRNGLDTGSTSHIEAASRRSGLQYRRDEPDKPREVDQSTRERSSRSSDPPGSQDLALTDNDLVLVREREEVVRPSPSELGSGSSVFVSKRK